MSNENNYLDWPIGLPYLINSGSTYESYEMTISSFSSLFWLSLNYLRVWISLCQYCSRSVAVTNEAWHLFFKVRNSAWVGLVMNLLNLLNLMIMILKLFVKSFVDTRTLDWICPTIWCWILWKEKGEKEVVALVSW